MTKSQTAVQVGDRVEDARPKLIFSPDFSDRYAGIYGDVTAVSADGSFTVAWESSNEGPAYTVSYDPAFLEMGIRICDKDTSQ